MYVCICCMYYSYMCACVLLPVSFTHSYNSSLYVCMYVMYVSMYVMYVCTCMYVCMYVCRWSRERKSTLVTAGRTSSYLKSTISAPAIGEDENVCMYCLHALMYVCMYVHTLTTSRSIRMHTSFTIVCIYVCMCHDDNLSG